MTLPVPVAVTVSVPLPVAVAVALSAVPVAVAVVALPVAVSAVGMAVSRGLSGRGRSWVTLGQVTVAVRQGAQGPSTSEPRHPGPCGLRGGGESACPGTLPLLGVPCGHGAEAASARPPRGAAGVGVGDLGREARSCHKVVLVLCLEGKHDTQGKVTGEGSESGQAGTREDGGTHLEGLLHGRHTVPHGPRGRLVGFVVGENAATAATTVLLDSTQNCKSAQYGWKPEATRCRVLKYGCEMGVVCKSGSPTWMRVARMTCLTRRAYRGVCSQPGPLSVAQTTTPNIQLLPFACLEAGLPEPGILYRNTDTGIKNLKKVEVNKIILEANKIPETDRNLLHISEV